MDIGLALALGGIPTGDRFQPPTWRSIRDQAVAAEAAGFDLVIAEDALSQPIPDGPVVDHWESMTVLGAVAAATSRIRLGHGVVNAPYRAPGLLAKSIETLDEISGGRVFLGIGAGNTPDADYRAFGIPASPRFSRFEETIRIVAQLLRGEVSDLDGTYHRTEGARLQIRGPQAGPPIVVAGQGPRMLRLAAELADGWNWWIGPHGTPADLQPTLDGLEQACEEVGRDPATLRRTLDAYLPLAPAGLEFDPDRPAPSDEETAEAILAFAEVGIAEVRCYVHPHVAGSRELARRVGLVEELAGVVELVHAA